MPGPRPLWSLALAAGLGLAPVGAPARAQAPEDFDPLLDVSPRLSGPGRRLHDPDPRAPGLAVAAFAAAYTGATRSFLTTERSDLQTGTHPTLGFGLGYRTASPFEVVSEVGLSFGQTWSPAADDWQSAADVLVQLKLNFHGLEWDRGGFYAGAGVHLGLFDVDLEGLNQAGVGPLFVVGGQRRLGQHLLVYLEVGYSPLFDFLAYRFEDPSEAELLEDPTAPRIKVTGAWFHVALIQLGFRLTAL